MVSGGGGRCHRHRVDTAPRSGQTLAGETLLRCQYTARGTGRSETGPEWQDRCPQQRGRRGVGHSVTAEPHPARTHGFVPPLRREWTPPIRTTSAACQSDTPCPHHDLRDATHARRSGGCTPPTQPGTAVPRHIAVRRTDASTGGAPSPCRCRARPRRPPPERATVAGYGRQGSDGLLLPHAGADTPAGVRLLLPVRGEVGAILPTTNA